VTEVSADLVTAPRLFVQMVEGIKKSQRRGNNDALARQMIRKRFSARPLALEGFDRGGARRLFGGEFVFRRLRPHARWPIYGHAVA
jgi:hypothetical protein